MSGAGVFCMLYIDGVLVERAFCPLEKDDIVTRDGKVRQGAGNLVREWEISGRFYRGADERAYERRFGFTERVINANASKIAEVRVMRVVLFWARPNPDVIDPYPRPTEKLADEIAERLSKASCVSQHRTAVALGPPVSSGVKENNMQVERVDNQEFTFLFHYAHPAWLVNEGEPSTPVPNAGPVL